MKIKFNEYATKSGKKKNGDRWSAFIIKGEVLEESGKMKAGDEWTSTNIFDSDENEKIIDTMMDLKEGDMINVRHERDGKYWTISSIEAITEEDLFKGNKGGGGGGGYGGGGSKWNGRTGDSHNRSAALYLAFDIMKETLTEAKKKKMQVGDLFELADILFAYMDDGSKSGQVPHNKGVENAEADPLDV